MEDGVILKSKCAKVLLSFNNINDIIFFSYEKKNNIILYNVNNKPLEK